MRPRRGVIKVAGCGLDRSRFLAEAGIYLFATPVLLAVGIFPGTNAA